MPGVAYDRVRIEPPPSLSEKWGSNVAGMELALERLVAPLWDDAVRYIHDGRYLDLVALRDTLGRKADGLARQRWGWMGLVRPELALIDVLRAEAETFGREATIGDSLGSVPPSAPVPEEGVRWTRTDRGYRPVLGVAGLHAYQLDGQPVPPSMGFGPRTTWGAAIEAVRATRSDVFERDDELLRDYEPIDLRRRVIGAVLEEYSLNVDITLWAERGPVRYRELARDEVIVSICRALLQAYDEDGGRRIGSRDKLYSEAADLLEGGYTAKRVRDRLNAPGVEIHQSSSKRGTSSSSARQAQLAHVVAEARAVVEQADRMSANES